MYTKTEELVLVDLNDKYEALKKLLDADTNNGLHTLKHDRKLLKALKRVIKNYGFLCL